MSDIPLKPRSYKKLTLILVIVVIAILSIIFIGIGTNWFGTVPSDGGGG